MSNPWADALPIFAKVLGVAIVYSGDGIVDLPLQAPKVDEPADEFQGFAGKARRIVFEVTKADLPREAEIDDLIVETVSGLRWSVVDRADRDDVTAWGLVVEQAEAAE